MALIGAVPPGETLMCTRDSLSSSPRDMILKIFNIFGGLGPIFPIFGTQKHIWDKKIRHQPPNFSMVYNFKKSLMNTLPTSRQPFLNLFSNIDLCLFSCFLAQKPQIWKFSPRPPQFQKNLKLIIFFKSYHGYTSKEPKLRLNQFSKIVSAYLEI